MEKKKSVGIWIRVSTEDQALGDSPEHHEARARYYAEARGWDIKVVYHMEGVSGKSVMQHSETKKMLKDIKDRHITGLIFSKLARLARNTRELLDFADYFREYDADLISLQEAIDTSTPAGRLFYTIIAAMSQWEREEIASRVAASVPIRAKLGKSLGGQASYGYRWEGKKLVIDQKEAQVRKLLYELFLKNKRKKTTAEELNKLGYRTRNGSPFSDTTVNRLLRDPTAKGMRRANYTRSLGEGKQWKLKPTTDWVLSECPAIVSEDIWNKCNHFLDEQEKKRKKPGRVSTYLLAGYVTCTCGKNMYVFHTAPVFTCKVCKNKITVDDIDAIYHEQFKSFLFTDADVSKYLEQSNVMIQEKEKLLLNAIEETSAVRSKMEELVTMRLNKELSRESFPKHYQPLEEKLNQLEPQIPELEATIDYLKVQNLSSDTVLREAKDLYNRWTEMPFEEKRNIVEIITEKIEVGKEDITINLSYLPTPNLPQNGGTKQRNSRGS